MSFPQDIENEAHAHDPISRASVLNYKRQPQVMAAILGEGAVDELDSVGWVVADPSHPNFGEVIDAQLMATEATGVGFTLKGVVLCENEELFVEKISLRDVDDWRGKKGKELGDLRLLGDHRDNAGKRRLELSAAVALMHNAEDKEFPIAGTRSSKELHESAALGPGNFLSYHAEWLRSSGVSGRSSSAHVHRNLCKVLRLLHSYDQVDCSSLAAGETLCRWMIQTELAVERSPSMPDYSGLDIAADTATLPHGRASTSKFNKWVSAGLKERASIWKQERLFRQERKTRGGKGKDDIH